MGRSEGGKESRNEIREACEGGKDAAEGREGRE